MNITELHPPPCASQLLAGMLTKDQFLAETGWHWRTLLRREHDGLPVVKLGNTKLYPIDKCRAWILRRVADRSPRRPGRPRRAA